MAEQTEPVRRRVALKLIKLGMDTRAVVARFEAERQALAMMDHPNIAKVLDAGTTGDDPTASRSEISNSKSQIPRGRPYFVMELVRGLRITDSCDQQDLSTNERLDLFIKVCQAIQHAHQKEIIHRDIKPSNILVTLHDGVPVPKVIDFGIAKAVEGRLTDATVYTQVHQFIGTPAYMSPEQAEMSGLDIDTRSDIYSLGVLLYELLTGKTPFDPTILTAAGLDEARRIIREKEPVRPSTRLHTLGVQELTVIAQRRGTEPPKLVHLVRGDLDWIVMKCLEKDRSRRYETANGLARDVQRHLQNQPVLAGPPSTFYAFRKFVLRNKWPVILNATVAVLTVAGLIGTSIGLRRATVARNQATQNAARAQRLAEDAKTAETTARVAESNALRQAYSASMLSASDALEQGQIETAKHYLNSAPENLRGWEWQHLSSRLDMSTRVRTYPRGANARLHLLPDGRSYYDVPREAGGGIRRWDLEMGQLLATLPTSHGYFQSWLVAGGKQLLAIILDDPLGTIDVWDLERGAQLPSLTTGLNGVDISPDGSLAAYEQGSHLHIRDMKSGATRVASLAGSFPAVGFQPDGKQLVAVTILGKVTLLDTQSLQILRTFEPSRNYAVSTLAFSADAHWLAIGSLDGTIRLLDVATDRLSAVATLHAHNGWVVGLCFSPDGSLLASAGRDQILRLWDTKEWSARAVFQSDGFDPKFLPDGQTLINGGAQGVRFWDVRASDAWVLRGHRSYVYPVLLSPDGATIYSGGWDGYAGHPGSLRFWDAATGNEIAALGEADRYVRAAALSVDGSRLAISLASETKPSRIDILDTATGAAVARIPELGEGHPRLAIDSLAMDPAAENLIWVDWKNGVGYLADTRTGAVKKSRKLFAGAHEYIEYMYSRVAWSPDGAIIAVCNGGEPSIDLLNPQTLELVRRWPHGHTGLIYSVAFSPDSRRLITTAEDGIARVWDTATGARLHDLVGHASRVLCAVFSPDGKRIATGGHDHNVRLWDAETFDQVVRLSGHESWVYSLAWRADSQLLISGSGDTTVRIWDTQPLMNRMQARRERQVILAQVQPTVQRLLAELGDARRVVDKIKADPSLDARARQIALQVTLGMSLDRLKATAP